MFYEPDKNDHGLPHNPYKSCVIPRPIGWITTKSRAGVVNLAPYSQFNNLGYDPPYVMFAANPRPDGSRKDSAANAVETGEFVCNMATRALHDQVDISSQMVDPEVDETVLAGLRPLENAFAAHTFNEVWVGGRWRRLNYDHLGQNTLSRNCFGLLTKVNTFHDLADANLAATWGTCSLTGWNSSSFLHSNPYSARSLDDRFGAHAELPNPPAQSREHFHADIVKAYWHDSDQDRPDFIGRDAVADDDNGHVFLEARHWIEDEGIAQYRRFWQAADKEFVLKAEGRRDVKASAERGHWRNHFYIQIPAAQMRHLAAGVAYRLVPRNRNSDHQWRIDEDVRIVGRGADGPPPPATTAGEVTTTRPDSEHRSLTIGRLRDFHDPSIPDWIRDTELPQDGSRHLLAEVAEWIPGQDGDQLILFTERADSEVSFVARGEKTVRGVVLQGCMNSTDGEIRLVWVMVDPGEARKIEAGVEYRLKPRNKGSRYRWKVSDAARFTWE